jgi:hypothetical protein
MIAQFVIPFCSRGLQVVCEGRLVIARPNLLIPQPKGIRSTITNCVHPIVCFAGASG